MGSSQSDIRAAGIYLLDVLAVEHAVNLGRFYNFAPDTEASRAAALWQYIKVNGSESEYSGPEDEALILFGPVLIEEAAWQLEDLGVVAMTPELLDGVSDYKITLTEQGERFRAEGCPFEFRGVGSRTKVTGASEWLIDFLGWGDGGQTLTLRDVMNYGESYRDVSVTDEYGNVYRLGTRSYAWGFEVSMWHHARSGNIEPVFEVPEQRAVWEAFTENPNILPRPVLAGPHPHWDVPFRLTPKGTKAVTHVGWVGGE